MTETKEFNVEMICMDIISNSGLARSLLLEAMDYLKPRNEEKIQELFKEANQALKAAHRSQTSLLHAESGGQKVEMTVLLVHAQDHLMTTLAIRDMTEKFMEVL
ncbi:Lichenan-specific phosphotransferase enzyme IIA component [compost metagenome]